ncbi:MAG: hypothetical protein ABI625_12530 [bacterium]
MRDEPVLPPSARVQLEVAFLDDTGSVAPDPAAREEPARFTVLVVSSDSDVRRYVGECFRTRRDIRVLEVATGAEAVGLAEYTAPDLLIVDESESRMLTRFSALPVIVMADDAPCAVDATHTRIRVLFRPFSAERLMVEVERILA